MSNMMNQRFLILALVLFVGCELSDKNRAMIGDVSIVVSQYEKYNGNWVRIVGYLHEPYNGIFKLIPSKEHIALGSDAAIFSLRLEPDELIRNGNVKVELSECAGKISYISGKAGIFSGMPVINEVREVSC